MVCAGVVSGLVGADRADAGALGDAVALHAERARRIQGRPAFLHASTATSAAISAKSTSSAARCILLTGEYDYSCTAEGTLAVAERTGAAAVIMKGLGHFPMSEDPEKFVSYLLPVLEKIKAL